MHKMAKNFETNTIEIEMLDCANFLSDFSEQFFGPGQKIGINLHF